MASAVTQLTPDEIEDKVLEEILHLGAAGLEAACEVVVDLVVPDTAKGNKKLLRNLLTKYLMETSDEDDKHTDFLTLHDHLFPKVVKKELEQSNGVDAKPDEKLSVGVDEVFDEKTLKKSTEKEEDRKPLRKQIRRRSNTIDTVDITRVRFKEFKLPGMIGGTGESAMSFSSLQYEIENGRKLGHKDAEMCAVVISKVADRELQSYFHEEKNIKLEDVMDMLKSTCTKQENTAKTVFTKFSTDRQGEKEKTLTFITRVLRRRKTVLKLAAEEGIKYDEEMLGMTAFQVIFEGIRDENIRTALRNKWGDDYLVEDKVFMKHAAEVVASEQARKQRLFGKDVEPEIEVNAINSRKSVSFEEKEAKKEKLNPFTKIEELRAELRADINEIKNLVLENNKRNQKEDKPKPVKTKCDACIAAKKWRCYHCWKCGKGDHKSPDCPENC